MAIALSNMHFFPKIITDVTGNQTTLGYRVTSFIQGCIETEFSDGIMKHTFDANKL